MRMWDDHFDDAIKYLSDALKVTSTPKQERGLRKLLTKLNIKSAQMQYSMLSQGAPLRIESLDVTLKDATFDAGNIKLWRNCGGNPTGNTDSDNT